MASTLRDELSSLRIERRSTYRPTPGERMGSGLSVLSALLWLIPLTLVVGAGAIVYQQYDKLKPRQEVTVGLVQAMTSGEAEKLLSAKGYLKSRHQAMIGSRMPGRVEQMLVEEGDRVQKGQVLAVLEHDDLQAMLESRQAMVMRTEAELREAQADLRDKQRRAQREARLRLQNHSSQENLEQAEAARDMAIARVAALEASLRLNRASVREAEETIRNMHIYAPFHGTVVAKESEVGETITPGGMGAASGRGSVVTLADLDHLEVETDISENLLARVKIGQPAEVVVSAVPGKRYRGRLRQIIPMGDRTRGTVKVNVEVLDPDERLFPELVATVHFLPDKALEDPETDGPSLFAPRAAIIEEAGHWYAWVVDDQQFARKRRVDVVVTNDSLARVEDGLQAGESVILNPVDTLRDGMPVAVAQ